jgi:hypothetical protein
LAVLVQDFPQERSTIMQSAATTTPATRAIEEWRFTRWTGMAGEACLRGMVGVAPSVS